MLMKSSGLGSSLVALSTTVFTAALFGGSPLAHGAVISGNSNGYGVNASVSVVGSLVTLSVPTLGLSQGSATPAYSASQNTVNVNANAGLNLGVAAVTLGAINGTAFSTASSTIDGTAG